MPPTQVRELLLELNYPLDDAEFDALMAMLDYDKLGMGRRGDGEIDYNEFLDKFGDDVAGAKFSEAPFQARMAGAAAQTRRVQQLSGLLPTRLSSAAEVRRELGARLASRASAVRPLFRRYDEDHSGTITEAELRELLKDLNYTLADAEFAKLLEAIDVSGDGLIDYREFMASFGKDVDG